MKPPAKAEGPVRKDEIPTDAELRRFAAGGKPVREILSPDGRQSLSWEGNDLRLWDAKTGKELRRLRGHTDRVTSAAFSPDGKHILSGGLDRSVRMWDAATGEQLRAFEGHTGHVHGVAFAPDGKRVASAAGGFEQRKNWCPFIFRWFYEDGHGDAAPAPVPIVMPFAPPRPPTYAFPKAKAREK